MKRGSRPATRTVLVTVLAIWLACMVVPPALLLRVRKGWLQKLDRPAAQEDWDAFRHDMQKQSGRAAPISGPVQRKVPRSAEPPLRVWLRDYVGLAIAAWVVFGSVLVGFLATVIVGLLAQDQPRGGRDGKEQQQGDGEHAEQ